MREIAFDTETTGLEWDGDDRIIELGAVELENHLPTGKTFRRLINPGRPVSAATIRITGITDDDLRDKPTFDDPDIMDAFLEFVSDATLVAHNAKFDRGFLNAELVRYGRAPIPEERWIDTVMIARKKFPGAPASLDALCKRFDVSLSDRSFHGALLDSQLLARVYLELLGGRARAFEFEPAKTVEVAEHKAAKPRSTPLKPLLSTEEKLAHEAFQSKLGDKPFWKKVSV